MVVTWSTDEQHDIAIRSVKDQLAFYGSTPAYAPVLDAARIRRSAPRSQPHVEGGALGGDGARSSPTTSSKRSRWWVRVARSPRKISARANGITDRVSLVNNRNPDPDLFADIVADLRTVG